MHSYYGDPYSMNMGINLKTFTPYVTNCLKKRPHGLFKPAAYVSTIYST